MDAPAAQIVDYFTTSLIMDGPGQVIFLLVILLIGIKCTRRHAPQPLEPEEKPAEPLPQED